MCRMLLAHPPRCSALSRVPRRRYPRGHGEGKEADDIPAFGSAFSAPKAAPGLPLTAGSWALRWLHVASVPPAPSPVSGAAHL